MFVFCCCAVRLTARKMTTPPIKPSVYLSPDMRIQPKVTEKKKHKEIEPTKEKPIEMQSEEEKRMLLSDPTQKSSMAEPSRSRKSRKKSRKSQKSQKRPKPTIPTKQERTPQIVAGVTKQEESGLEDPRFRGLPTEEKNLPDGTMYMKRVLGDDRKPLKRQLFYHGLLPKDQTDKMMRKNGDFLVRETNVTDTKRVEILSVFWNGSVKHYVIGKTKRDRYHVGYHLFDSIKDLIDWYVTSGRPLSADNGPILRIPILRQQWQFTHDQIRLVEKVGEGAFGEVHKGILVEGTKSQQVAVKIDKSQLSEKKERSEFLKEFKVMQSFDHPNVVKVYGVAAEKDPMMIVMEYLPGGSLLNYLRQRTIHIRIRNRMRFCTEAAAGLRYLEKNKCMHRDVAARNCLIGPKKEIKIADFGLSRFDVSFTEEKGKKVPIKWLAPETLRTGTYTMANDVWSFGVLMWEIYSDGADPYPGMNNAQVRRQVTSSKFRMKMPHGMPPFIAKLIQEKCWLEEATKRPSFEKIHRKLLEMYQTYL